MRKLDSTGFSWNHHADQWEKRYGELVEYKQQNGGSCNVPHHFEQNPRLDAWVNHQRREYQKFMDGKESQMNHERISRLGAIRFQWSNFVPVSWQRCYDDLVTYKAEHRDCNVPRNFEGDPILARWVNEQRRAYKQRQNGQKSQMNKQRIDALENLGFL